MNKLNKTEVLANLLWTVFGIFGGISYYSKAEYWFCGAMFLLGILYCYKLIKSIMRNRTDSWKKCCGIPNNEKWIKLQKTELNSKNYGEITIQSELNKFTEIRKLRKNKSWIIVCKMKQILKSHAKLEF